MTDREAYSRRETLKMGAAGASTILIPISSHTALHVAATPLLRDNWGLTGYSPRPNAITFSDNRISVHVVYNEGEKESLQEWIDADSNRDTLTENDPIKSMTVAVPAGDIGLGISSRIFGGGLADKSYVEQLDLAFRERYAEPLEGLDGDAPIGEFGGIASTLMRVYGESPPGQSGIAFDEAPNGNIEDAREVVGAGDSEGFWSSVDTSTLTVAVIDTGWNSGGGDILNDETRVLDASKNMINGETKADDGIEAVEDGNGHGSWVASCIAADPPNDPEYQGFLPNADLLIIKALADDGSGKTDHIGRAITYAADNDADLICMSLGSPVFSLELAESLAYADGADAISFIAAGNDRQGTRWVASPADNMHSIAVGAGTIQAPTKAESAYFSNIGPDPGTTDFSEGETNGRGPDIAAPGMNLDALTADTVGNVNTERLSGTSMATPVVVGVAGLVLAETDVERNVNAVKTRIQDYAAPAPNVGVTEFGSGYPDAAAAINETEPDNNQADARDGDAVARDESYRALSNVYGNRIMRLVL